MTTKQKTFATFVQNAQLRYERATPEPSPLPVFEDAGYASPQDVPIPLRHTLKTAHESGLTIHQLAQIYELPADWIALFVLDAGNC